MSSYSMSASAIGPLTASQVLQNYNALKTRYGR